jgi:hypothetical protein
MKQNAPSHPVRRFVAKAMSAAAGLTLVTTGLVAPAAQQSRARPIIDSRVHVLSDRAVEPGFSVATDTGLPTEAVGFQWNGNKAGAVEVRSLVDGQWSDWTRVEGNPAEGPDVKSKEHRSQTGAGPIWVGHGVQKVETRVVEGSLEGLKLHAIRSEEPPASTGFGTKPAGSAVAQPGIASRANWGADESWRSFAPGCNGQPEYASSVRFAVVHHTDGSNNYGPGDTPAILRSIYYFHTHTNMWCDIAYNFLVDRFGQVFEGRAGGITSTVIGAHALNYNTQSTGVALVGSFTDAAVPQAMYNSLRAVLAWKLDLHAISPLATINYNGNFIKTVIGHRDVNSTDCPGNQAYALLPQLRSELAGMVGTPPAAALVSANSGKVADIGSGSQTPGAKAIQSTWSGAQNQQWRMVPLGNQLYKIVNFNSGMVLDVAGGSTAEGAKIVQWPWNGGPNQIWRAIPFSTWGGDPNTFLIISSASGKVLDVNGASKADGASLIQWTWNGGLNQIWVRAVIG